MTKSKSIVLIHGNFVNNNSWSEWKRYYEQKGYKVYTPANPKRVMLQSPERRCKTEKPKE